jgi:hypothetical protein
VDQLSIVSELLKFDVWSSTIQLRFGGRRVIDEIIVQQKTEVRVN